MKVHVNNVTQKLKWRDQEIPLQKIRIEMNNLYL